MSTQTYLIVLAPIAYGGISYPVGFLVMDPGAVAGIEAAPADARKWVAIQAAGSAAPAPPSTVSGGTGGTSSGVSLTSAQSAALANEPLDALTIASQGVHLAAVDSEIAALVQRANSTDIVDGNQNVSLASALTRLAADDTAIASLLAKVAALQGGSSSGTSTTGTSTGGTTTAGDANSDFSTDYQ